MKIENNQINNMAAYINYVVNVLRFDVFSFLKEIQNGTSELDALGSIHPAMNSVVSKINNASLKTRSAVRDTLALLLFAANNGEEKEISLNKFIDKTIKNLYVEPLANVPNITVSYTPPGKDILVKCDEIILESVLENLFYLAHEQITESKVIFSTSFESNFVTVTLKYKGKKHKMMNTTTNNSEERELTTSLAEFNHPYTLIKLMEKIGLGVISFSDKENYNIINFTLHLITRESENQQQGKISSIQEHNWKEKTVLIVDDIEVNYIFLETILADTRVKTLYASNGKIAVDMCRQHKDIDAVLMDIKMPVMDGYEATKIIKQEFPELPVIIQTAYSFNEEYEKCKELGCNDYITKPLKSENVISVLAKYFII
jgi:two-component system, cell cycle response regulator DivK